MKTKITDPYPKQRAQRMITFEDKTWCASPNCKGECGRKMTPELIAIIRKQSLPVCWEMFCGGENPTFEDIKKAMSNE